MDVAELIALPEVPEAVREDLATLQPSQRLHVVDFPAHRQDDLAPGNVVSLQIGFEYAGPSDYARLLPAVAGLADAGLRRTVYEWVVRRTRRDGLVLGEVDMEGTYFRSRIGENMRRATRAWFAEGRAEGVEEGLRRGREQGRAQGLEQQRALLARQITTKFGAGAAQRVGPLLDGIADPALLAEVGDALLVSAVETELVARIEAVIASMTPSADTDPRPRGTDRQGRCPPAGLRSGPVRGLSFRSLRCPARFIRVRGSISSGPNAGDCGAPALAIRIGWKAGIPAPLPDPGALR